MRILQDFVAERSLSHRGARRGVALSGRQAVLYGMSETA